MSTRVRHEPRPVTRVRVALMHLRDGLYFGYPLCCVVRFALSGSDAQAIARGVVDPHGENPWVPCQVFHHGVPWDEVNHQHDG